MKKIRITPLIGNGESFWEPQGGERIQPDAPRMIVGNAKFLSAVDQIIERIVSLQESGDDLPEVKKTLQITSDAAVIDTIQEITRMVLCAGSVHWNTTVKEKIKRRRGCR